MNAGNKPGAGGLPSLGVLLWWVPCLCLAGLAGCACPKTQAGSGPEATLRQYRRALEQNDAKTAFALLSSGARGTLSESLFAKWIEEQKRKRELPPESLVQASDLTITLEDKDATVVRLRQEQGVWRLAAGPMVPSGHETPEAVAERFLSAIERGDCESLIGTAPPSVLGRYSKEQLRSGCERRLESLRPLASSLRAGPAVLTPVSETQMELASPKDGSAKLILKKYGGGWFVENL